MVGIKTGMLRHAAAVLEPSGRILEVNSRFENFFGKIIPDSESNVSEVFGGDFPENFTELKRGIFSFRKKDNSLSWLYEFLVVPLDSDEFIITFEQKNENFFSFDPSELFLFFNNISQAVFLADKQGRLKIANNAFLQLTGCKASNLAGKELRDFVDNEFFPQYDNMFRKAKLITDGNFGSELKLRCNGKTSGWVKMEINAVSGKKETVLYGTVIDIARQRETEERLTGNYYFIQSIIDAIPLPVYYKDKDLTYRGCNKTFAEYLETPVNEIIGNSVSDVIISRELAEKIDSSDREILEKGNPVTFEMELESPSGKKYDILLSKHLYHDLVGNPAGIVGVLTDITGLKQTENALKLSEAKYRTLYENAHDAILIFSTEDEKILDANKSACRMYGFTLAELKDKSLKELSKNTEKGDAKLQETIDKGFIQNFETVHYHKNGSEINIETNGTLIEYMGYQAIISIQRDITKRKAAEKALRESEVRYKGLIESQTDLIKRVNMQGMITFANEAFCKKFGKTPEEITGSYFRPEIHPQDRKATDNEIKKLLVPPYRIVIEHRAKTPEGWRWFHWEDKMILGENGELKEVQGVGRDITESREIDDALKVSEKKFRELAENVRDGFFIMENGKFIYASPAFENIFGLRNVEVIKDVSLFYDSICPNHREEIKAKLTSGEITGAMEFRVKPDKNSKEKWVEVKVSATEVKGGKRLFGIVTETTEKKEAEAKILYNLKREQELNELKSGFISLVSHEFRTPLATILSSTELLEMLGQTWPEEKKAVHHERIKKAVDTLVSMLNDVSQINKADSGVIDVTKEKTDITEFIHSMIEETKSNMIVAPRIHYITPENKIEIKTDSKLLRQVFSNLLSNAVKYTPSEKNVYVELTHSEQSVTISVKDEGIGIPKDEGKIIFEPFTRCKNTGDIKGTGLGLSIVKRASEMLGANLSFESKPGEGTLFYFTLPKD